MIELASMAVEMPEVEGHPNRAGFRGVLTVVDVASQRAPSGSRGHRVVLTKMAAEAALPSLLGMALDYAPTFDRHDQRRKVGIITSADIAGRNLVVTGYLYAKDFPEIVAEIAMSGRRLRAGWSNQERNRGANEAMGSKRRCESAGSRAPLANSVQRVRELRAPAREANRAGRTDEVDVVPELSCTTGLGMSYEVANVVLSDIRARVWTLTHVTFTGAAVLRRDKAAYEDTWIGLTE